MVSRLDNELQSLNIELIKMGVLCESIIASAVHLLYEESDVQYKKVYTLCKDIEKSERDIEGLCMKILLRQQPVAKDLRVVSSALKMIYDMQRIGNQAWDIAEIAKFVRGYSSNEDAYIKNMAQSSIGMVSLCIESFVKKDEGLAREVILKDDVVDGEFDAVKKELIRRISSGSRDGEYYIDMLMIAKYLERIADHSVNIANWVIYSITGKHCPNDSEEI